MLTSHKKKTKNNIENKTLDNAYKPFKWREIVINALENNLFSLPKQIQHFKWEIKKKTKTNNLFHKKKDQKIM